MDKLLEQFAEIGNLILTVFQMPVNHFSFIFFFNILINIIFTCSFTVSLKKRLLSAYNLEKRPSIQWGLTHEKSAIDCYCKTSEITVLQTGMHIYNKSSNMIQIILAAFAPAFIE